MKPTWWSVEVEFNDDSPWILRWVETKTRTWASGYTQECGESSFLPLFCLLCGPLRISAISALLLALINS